jgi:hypothetical protein
MRHTLLFIASAWLCAPSTHAANWEINRVNHVVLTPPGGVTVAEMSGVTYLGPAGGNHRFLAAEETKGELVQFDLALSAAGGITAVSNVAAIDIVPTLDFEGVAYTNAARNSVFISDENGPGVREISLSTGAELQPVAIPPVFANRRANLGFESLARSPDGAVMWAANEQALTVDGPLATSAAGTNVRLLQLNVAGDAVAVGSQFAYRVEPIHGTSTFGSPQSGLSDLVAMPDGTVISLERSVSLLASPSTYLSRIYEIDFAGATDVSIGPTAAGLIGQTFTPVGKQLLWSGPAEGANGQNLEGLTLGPRLANGSWVLIGVVDDGDELSNNTIVAFTASAIPSADFNADGAIDGTDFLNWQRGLGQTVGAAHTEGDADRDGDVDADDLTQWKADFAAPGELASATVPEPATAFPSLGGLAALAVRFRKKRKSG